MSFYGPLNSYFVRGFTRQVRTKSLSDCPSPLILCGKELPWVSESDHLGHILSSNGKMESDCLRSRADFIDKSVKTREMFNFAHPIEVLKAIDKYASCFYGSNLWDLGSREAEMLYASWRTNVKLIWGLPRQCKTLFIDHLAPFSANLKVSLLSRFHNFFHGLLHSPSAEVVTLANLASRDMRTNVGRNLRLINELTGLDPWCYGNQRVKHELKQNLKKNIPSIDSWRLPYLDNLLASKATAYYYNDRDTIEELNNLIYSLVTS